MTDIEKTAALEKTEMDDRSPPSPPFTTTSTIAVDESAKSPDGATETPEPAPAPAASTLPPPPDGGAHAWMTVAGAFLAVFVQFGLANAFGVFQGYYETHFLAAYKPQDISWIGGTQQFLLFFGGLFSGRAMDAYGGHAVFIPGSIMIVLSLMLTSLCTKYYQFMLAQGVLFGLGSALVFSPAVSIPSQWFLKRRALATSIAVAGSGLGGTLWPIVLNRLFVEIGFAWTLRTVGFIALALLATANALIRTRLPRRKPSPLKNTFAPFKDSHYALLASGLMVCTWAIFNPFFYITLNATRLGASTSLAFYCVSFLNAGSTVGRLFAGVADKWGRFNVLAGASGLVSIFLLAFWTTLNSVPALIAFAVLYGFLVGFIISLIPPAIAMISKPHEIGARVGLVYTCGAVFVLTGPPISGAFVTAYPGDRGWQYIGVFSGLVAAVGTILVTLARFKVNPKVFVIV